MTGSITDIAKQCLNKGLSSLSAEDEHELYIFFRKEVRKNAFKIQETNTINILKAFCQYIIADSEVLRVMDFQLYLRKCAKDLSAARPPIASLVLYATCVEHWLNMMLTVAKLRQGNSPSTVGAYFDTGPKIKERLKLLGPISGLSEFPDSLKIFTYELVGRRNDYVHYSWQGLKPEKVEDLHTKIHALVQKAEVRLDEMRLYEWDNFDKQYDTQAMSIFPRARHNEYWVRNFTFA